MPKERIKAMVGLTAILGATICLASATRTFSIDYGRNQFLLDGKPFRYASSSIHYFRVHPALWRDRLTKIRAAGFNAIQFVIPWNMHQRYPNETSFSGPLDIPAFLKIAQDLDLYALVRPGPYICAEHNGGGLPWWLYKLHPDIKLRSSDPNFLSHVKNWWNELMPQLKPSMIYNGGNIIMVQMENEYGSYGCDFDYTTFLKDQALSHLGSQAVLYTTDGAGTGYLKCGKIPGVYATIDFGSGYNATQAFHQQRLFEPNGPMVNSEYYPAWLDYWGLKHQTLDANTSAISFDNYLAPGASVNVYMGHGGTSFGFENGINIQTPLGIEPTSYDYDGLVSEAGDLTEKYFSMKSVIAKYLSIPTIKVPKIVPKGNYGKVEMNFVSDLFSFAKVLSSRVAGPSDQPLMFEDMDQENGFALYQHQVKSQFRDPAILDLDPRDRALVFVNNRKAGSFIRQEVGTLPISNIQPGDTLSILVENLGRVGYGADNVDFKGLLKAPVLGNVVLKTWTTFSLPFNDTNKLAKYVNTVQRLKATSNEFSKTKVYLDSVPSLWTANFSIDCQGSSSPKDTFLDPTGWSKGVAFINGFNLGRYWPVMGPQVTLYVPRSVLHCGANNQVILLELERLDCAAASTNVSSLCFIKFTDKHVINGTVPNPPPSFKTKIGRHHQSPNRFPN